MNTTDSGKSQMITNIRSSWEYLLEKVEGEGEVITNQFYENLFEKAPETKRLFSDVSTQAPKLFATLSFVVANLDRLDDIIPSVEDLGRIHNRMRITEDQYILVSETLVETIAKAMGDDYKEQMGDSWREALGIIAKIMLNAPKEKSKTGTLLSRLFGGG